MYRRSHARAVTAFFWRSKRATRSSSLKRRGGSSSRWVRSRWRMYRSRPLASFLLTLLVGVVVTAGCRQQMATQPSYRPFQPSSLFADGTSARALPADTVARGQLRDDAWLFTGVVN